MCRLRRVSSADGSGFNQPIGVFMPSTSPGSSVVVAERRAAREAVDVRGWFPVSALRMIRSGTLWRAAPPFADLRIAACIS